MFTQDQIDVFFKESVHGLNVGANSFKKALAEIYPAATKIDLSVSTEQVDVYAVRDRLVAWYSHYTGFWYTARQDTIQSRTNQMLLDFNDLPQHAEDATRPANFDVTNKQHTDQFIVNLCCSYSRIVALRELLIDSGLRVYPELDHDSDHDNNLH